MYNSNVIFHFRAVVRELVETEEEFGRDLQQVVERYMKPVDKPTTPKAVSDNKDLVFNNFKQIADFHNTYVFLIVVLPCLVWRTVENFNRRLFQCPHRRCEILCERTENVGKNISTNGTGIR